jgi:MFS transporter, putative metabolite transport protein
MIGGKSIDDAPFKAFHGRTALLAAGGPFCDGYILGIVGIALPLLAPQLGLSVSWMGLIGASALIGLFVGGLIGGYATDLIGRKALYTLNLLAFVVLSAAQFFVVAAWQLFLLRLLIGIAIGADYPIATSYVAEFMPRKMRGPMLAGLVLAWWLGYIVSFLAGYAMSGASGDAWRWILASSAVPSLLVLLLRIGMPESPRWLLSVGRAQQAQAVLDRHIGPGYALEEILEPEVPGPRLRQLFTGGYGRLVAFVSIFWALQSAPSFAIHTLQSQLLTSLHVRGPLLATLIIIALALLGIGPTALGLVNMIGRRRLLIGTFVISAAPLALIGVLPVSPAWLVILAFIVYTISEAAGSGLQFVYPNELFPTSVRGTAVGFACAMSRLGAAVSTFLMPLGYTYLGPKNTMLITAAMLAIGALVSLAWAPETRGLSLAQASGLGLRNRPTGAPERAAHLVTGQ